MLKNKGLESEVTIIGDAKRGVITIQDIYPTVVTPEKLKNASAALAKAKAQAAMCVEPQVMSLNARGIGLQTILKDPNGTIFFSELCEGATFAPRPYGEQTEAQQVIYLANIVKGLEAKTLATNLNSTSKFQITFKGDSVKDAIYGKHAFKVNLSSKDKDDVEAEFSNITVVSEICSGGEVEMLNKNGIRFEYRVVDHLGKDIIVPLVCPAKNIVTLSPTPKLRGQTASR